MRAGLALAVLAACGGAPGPGPSSPASAPAASAPAPTEVTLEHHVETVVPGTNVTVTLLYVKPYEPREEDAQTGAVVERAPAAAVVKLRRGDAVEVVRWREGHNDHLGPAWTVSIDGHTVGLTRR